MEIKLYDICLARPDVFPFQKEMNLGNIIPSCELVYAVEGDPVRIYKFGDIEFWVNDHSSDFSGLQPKIIEKS